MYDDGQGTAVTKNKPVFVAQHAPPCEPRDIAKCAFSGNAVQQVLQCDSGTRDNTQHCFPRSPLLPTPSHREEQAFIQIQCVLVGHACNKINHAPLQRIARIAGPDDLFRRPRDEMLIEFA